MNAAGSISPIYVKPISKWFMSRVFGARHRIAVADACAHYAGEPYTDSGRCKVQAAAILWVNEFPDAEADAATGKHHLLATVGEKAGRWIYMALISAAFISTLMLVWAATLPFFALAMFLFLPLAIYAIRVVFTHCRDRGLIRANKATIQLHFLCALALVTGIIWNGS